MQRPANYFDILEGGHLVRDDEGLWFPDLASADREAEAAAASICREMRLPPGSKVTIEVRDENNNRVIGVSASLQVDRGLAT
jgi:hypothetical protein